MSHHDHHVETVIAHRKRQLDQLNDLAKMRNQPHISRFDRQMIQEMFNRDAGDLNDKDGEMIQTLAGRYLQQVAA